MGSGLFGVEHSNRDADAHWGKNCFNSSFPTALACYMMARRIPAIYIRLESDAGKLRVVSDEIFIEDVFKAPTRNPADLYFEFESVFSGYKKYAIDDVVDGIDLVVADARRIDLTPLEVKLTVLPTDSTHEKPEDEWGCELVVRSATTSYCALGMYDSVRAEKRRIRDIFETECASIQSWDNDFEMTYKTPRLSSCVDEFQTEFQNLQKPLLMQTIWKTVGKSPILADQAFDVVVWSDYAFSRLFLDNAFDPKATKMTRPMRASARLARRLWELSKSDKIRLKDIYRQMAFGTQTDKEFAIAGTSWRKYVDSDRVVRPILPKDVVYEIIDTKYAKLSPERRFDQTIYFTMLNR